MEQNASFSGNSRGQHGRNSGEQNRPLERTVRFAWFAALVLAIGGGAAYGQLSGQFGLDLVARRIPTTVTGEIKLDTPSEFAMLEFGIASNLDLKVDFGLADLLIDAATNMAGPEHLVLAGEAKAGSLAAYGIALDELSIRPEMWFAVPFEAVVDVNNLPNAVVIPPADPLFVALRLTTSWSYAGWSIKELLMFQDVNFPAPSSSFAPLYYPSQSQSYAWGSLTYVSWRAEVTSISGVIGFDAAQAGTSVKGYSAVGTVDPGNLFVTLSVSGICLGSRDCGSFALGDLQIGVSGTFTPTQTPSATVSFSSRLSKEAGIGGSLTLFGGAIPTLGGITLSLSSGPFQTAIALDTLSVRNLSASAGTSLSLGSMTGAFNASATGLERGLTGLAMRLSLAQGAFSAGTSVAFAQRGDEFGFASLGTQLAFRLSPGVLSFQATFGRYGLTRAALSTGVNF